MSRGGAKASQARRRKMDSIIEEMHPKQRDGLTIAGEDVGNMPAPSPTTASIIGHLGKEGIGRVGRLPAVQFVAEDDPSEFWSMGDERVVAGADVTFTPDTFAAIQSGMICLRCLEPQYSAFPELCCMEWCGYPIRDLQIRDLALEFKGQKHLGPSKPITEFMDEAEERYQKEKFARKIAEGKSPMKGLKHSAT